MVLSQRTHQSIPMRGARKGAERGGKENTWPHGMDSLALELCKLCCFYPQSSSFHALCCKLLLTHQVQASVSHLQKHFLTLHSVTPPAMFPLLTALLFPPRTWTICNSGPAATCSLPLHPHLDSSSVKVPPCLSTHVLVSFTLAVSCWTREPPSRWASLL